MVVKLGDEDIKKALMDSWDIIVNGVAKDRNTLEKNVKKGEWGIKSRTKIKSLVEGLRQHQDARASVTHFVKYAEYMLPRKPAELNNTLNELLKKTQQMRQECKNDYEKLQERIKYTIGYLAWSLDGFCNVLTVAERNPNIDAKVEIKNMLATELGIVDEGGRVEEYVGKLWEWKSRSEGGR